MRDNPQRGGERGREPRPGVGQSIEGSGNVGFNVGAGIGEVKVLSVAAPVGGGVHQGDVHHLYGDFHQQFVAEVQFQELSLAPYEPEHWVDPPGARDLVLLLAEHRLLFVAGDLADKSACARHLALLLRRHLGSDPELVVRERFQGSDPQRIEPALEGDAPALLLLIDLVPGLITFDSAAKLRLALAERGGYAIVTTDCSRSEWGIDGTSFEARLWIELSWESYYGRELLIEFLLRKLDPLPAGLLPETPGEVELVPGVPLTRVAQRLRSPAQLQEFAEALQSAADRSTAAVESMLESRAGDDQAILTWYRRFDTREQLLILGLTLLDGMPEEVVFAGLELLVGSTWRDTDPLLPQFDYRDLPRVSTYFKAVASAGGAVKLQSTAGEVRERILDVLWRHQRRRLLAALPALAELLRASDRVPSSAAPAVVEDRAAGSRPRPGGGSPAGEPDDEQEAPAGRLSRSANRLLQQALVTSLTLVARRSFEMVEPHFLDLLSDPSQRLRELAARAVAGLRDGEEAALFRRLRSWWTIARDYDRGDPIIERLGAAHDDPRAALRAAVALIVGFAARLDRPNRLAPELASLLSELIADPDHRVRSAVASTTIPSAVAWHFRQLEPFLRTRVLFSEDFIPAVAWGASEACRQRPEESLAILDGWRASARADRRQTSPLPRVSLLATVALTCGLIPCDPLRAVLSPEAIGARLSSLLAEEPQPLVRRWIFHAIQLQALRNFELVALILQDLILQVSLADRPAAVEVFVRTYLAQRERLPGGDARIAIGPQVFGIWTESARPLTEIEAALFNWVLDEKRPIAQQLAVDVFEALAETTLERAEAQLRRRNPAAGRAPAAALAHPAAERPRLNRLSPLGRMAVYLAAPRKRRVRALVGPLLAELLVVRRRAAAPRADFTSPTLRPRISGQPPLRAGAILERWGRAANEATRAMARHLARALTVYRWRWGIVAALIVTLVAATLGGRALHRRWSDDHASVPRSIAGGAGPTGAGEAAR